MDSDLELQTPRPQLVRVVGPVASSRARSRWFRIEQPRSGASLRLYCFHHAGGTSTLYRGWGLALPHAIEARYVVLPGREGRSDEAPATMVLPLARAIADEIASDLDRPYALLGHSYGGLLAYEVARVLRDRGLPEPEHLFVSGARAPHRWTWTTRLDLLPISDVVEELRRMGGTPEAVLGDRDLLEHFLPMIRADFRAVATYRHDPSAPLRCPITAMLGTDDRLVPADAVRAWDAHTRAEFAAHEIHGDHFFVKSAAARVIRIVQRELQRGDRVSALAG